MGKRTRPGPWLDVVWSERGILDVIKTTVVRKEWSLE